VANSIVGRRTGPLPVEPTLPRVELPSVLDRAFVADWFVAWQAGHQHPDEVLRGVWTETP